MKTFEKLESLGFFDWLSKTHNLRDTDMKPEYLDELPLNDIHRTVANSMVFRWFRKKYQIFPEVLTDCTTEPKFVYTYNTFYGNPKDLTEQEWGWENNIGQYSDMYRTYEEAELACLDKLLEIVETKSTQNTNDGRTMEKLIESNRKFDEKNNDNVKYDSSDRNEDMPNITNFFI